jgi:hypothetical protein
MILRVSTTTHSTSTLNLRTSLPEFQQRAKDNIEELNGWQEKKCGKALIKFASEKRISMGMNGSGLLKCSHSFTAVPASI